MKKIKLFLIITIGLMVLAACSSDDENVGATGEETDETVELTLGHILNEDHPAHITLEEMASEVEERSGGSIQIEISSGGALGTENDMISQVQMGALDMVYIAGISMFESLDSRLGIEDVPFLFADKQEAYSALDGAYGDGVKDILAETNINILGFWDAGFRHFTNNKRPIENPEDMNGIDFRSSPIDLRLAMFTELGATATPIDFNELFLALQQGTVDGQENPLSLITTNKFFEVQDYLSLSGHILNGSQVSIGSTSLDQLSSNQAEILEEVVIEYREVARDRIDELEVEYLEELKEAGMEVNEVNTDAFREATVEVEKIYIENNGDELLKLIKE